MPFSLAARAYFNNFITPTAQLHLGLQTNLTLDYIKENARTCVKDYGVKCIFIETIQSVFYSETEGNTQEGMENICHELKLLAHELNVPLIATSVIFVYS